MWYYYIDTWGNEKSVGLGESLKIAGGSEGFDHVVVVVVESHSPLHFWGGGSWVGAAISGSEDLGHWSHWSVG